MIGNKDFNNNNNFNNNDNVKSFFVNQLLVGVQLRQYIYLVSSTLSKTGVFSMFHLQKAIKLAIIWCPAPYLKPGCFRCFIFKKAIKLALRCFRVSPIKKAIHLAIEIC